MAKKTKGKSKKNLSKQNTLPAGFWAQVSAVITIVFSFFLILSWFGSGGPVLIGLHKILLNIMGYSTFILPLILIYLCVEIFRNEQNKLSGLSVFCSIIILTLFSGFFGLFYSKSGIHFGGAIGSFMNHLLLSLVNSIVAGIIYILSIFILVLSVLRITPIIVIRKIAELLKTNDFTKNDIMNTNIFKKASEETTIKESSKNKESTELKLNAGVEVLNKKESNKKINPISKIKENKGKVEKESTKEPATASFIISNWQKPSFDLLEKSQSPADAGDIEQNAVTIKNTLKEFNIDVEMESANIGPRVTQYTLRPPSGVKLSRIEALESNIALNLAATSLRIEAPIPGKRAVGIEVPNIKSADVRLFSIMNSKEWKNEHDPLSFAVGKDISGEGVVGKLSKMPHLLIAGQTGSGKSVMMNSLLTSLLYRHSPEEMKLILVDPKKVEMAPYEDIPHLLTPVINEPEKALSALKWAVNEMEHRYELLAKEKIREIKSYNKMVIAKSKENSKSEDEEPLETMSYIVIIIDELSDLMMVASKEVEALIVRLAQKARAVGIHLVLATQRPSVNVVTGLIKANVPSRIAFTVASNVDSRTILDQGGAEKLLGQGDMLFYVNGMSKPKRVQGAWVTDDEVNKICDYLRLQAPPRYNNEVIAQQVQVGEKGGIVMGDISGSSDSLFEDAVKAVLNGRASVTYLQRRLGIGYGRAAKLIDEMEEQGIVGPSNGSKPREVLISNIEDIK